MVTECHPPHMRNIMRIGVLSLLCISLLLQTAASSASLTVTERALGAIEGAFVADAATMPLHWM